MKLLGGNHYKRFLRRVNPIISRINEIETGYQSLSEEELKAKTAEFRRRIEEGAKLDDLLPEAFAAVKNGARRLCGKTFVVCGQEQLWEMVHYDVQLIGGIALHEGMIAEMSTGEGKTLVATLPLYLNALCSRNCQLITVNDYLARRDSEWMGQLFQYLGLTVGCIQQGMDPMSRREMYSRDITYGTASEFGFDYLRDNGMATRKEDQVQRDHYYVIIDEVDSILVDEARTPLIISGQAQNDRELPFSEFKPTVQRLVNEQNRFCNRLIDEAKKELERDNGNQQEAALQMLQVKMGMPKNKQLLRLMEKPEYRRILDKTELEMNGDFNKTQMFALKEELYYIIDEKQHQADLTEKGRTTLRPDDPSAFVFPDLPRIFSELDGDSSLSATEKEQQKKQAQDRYAAMSEEIHTIGQLLRAYSLYERDVEYVVQDGKVQIVDENTGRLMPGRRWGDGLHQAVEAKEGVAIEKETKTYATITIQNYFRLYDKLAGMTGTAETEATEFYDIYKLKVMVIPTHRPNARVDVHDSIFKTRREKFNAVLKEIQEAHNKGQPVLVGTVSVDASELLSRMLKRANIVHTVLNAKFHQQEAEIVARAGQRSAVTIATNMAGRGTDIKLGEGIEEIGGLYVIGTERHESRRIDRQLRGRCARQGDRGMSRFYISLEDNLMRLFANAGPLSRMMEKTLSDGDELQHPLLNRSIQSAQKKVEQRNYSIRKRLLQYDDVLNRQREVIYGVRNDAIHAERAKEIILEMIEEELEVRASRIDEDSQTFREDLDGLVHWINSHFPVALTASQMEEHLKDLKEFLFTRVKEAYENKESMENPESLAELERFVVIRAIDSNWQDHLTEMEDLRRSVGLRGYGQKDPLNEYKSEAYTYFEQMMGEIRTQVATGFFRSASNLKAFESLLQSLNRKVKMEGPADEQPAGASMARGGEPVSERKLPAPTPIQNLLPKVGRNDPCPCGSGKKYKKCCGS